MRRRRMITFVALGAALFLAVSALLARVLSADGAERAAITSIVQAEARGDQAAMRQQITGCRTSPGCQARVAQDITHLRHAGKVSIIQLEPSAGFSWSGSTGTARVVWTVGSLLPIVQCVRVRRAGNALSGLRVELLVISQRIKTDSSCSARF